MNSYSGKIDKSQVLELEKYFEADGALFLKPQYTIYQARIMDSVITFYESGKFVIQGKNTDKILEKYFNLESSENSQDKLANIAYPHIGIDESGKGDFFGPLVIAGVLLNEEDAKYCEELGIKDSKKLDDKKILALADEIKNKFIHNIVTIGNTRYNELYTKFKNLNRLLAWGHSTVLENILEKKECEIAISDKFGDEKFILSSLKEKGSKIKLIQETKAERDMAVAAASIIARAEFVKNISKLGMKYEMNFPKGASDKVIEAGYKFSDKYGAEELKHVAKLHFKTTQSLKNTQGKLF